MRPFCRTQWVRCLAYGMLLVLGWSHGQSLTNMQGMNLDFETADASGKHPAGWTQGALLDPDAHWGQYAARLKSDGKKVAIFQRKFPGLRNGRFGFWYKAEAGVSEAEPTAETNLSLSIVPIGEKDREYPLQGRVQYHIPAEHIGDGQWHHAELLFNWLDNPKVSYVYIGPRINEHVSQTMPTGPGNVLFDDFSITPIRALPRIDSVRLEETPGREGESAMLLCELRNAGDAPLQLRARADVYDGSRLRVKPLDHDLSELPACATRTLRWTLTGARTKTTHISVDLETNTPVTVADGLTCSPELRLEQLIVPRLVTWVGEEQPVSVRLANRGHAIATDVSISLDCPDTAVVCAEPTRLRFDRLLPGETQNLTWRIRGVRAGPMASLRVTVTASNSGPADAQRHILVSQRVHDDESPPDHARVRQTEKAFIIENPSLRLAFPKNSGGYNGLAEIQVWRSTAWRTLGIIPYLARVRFTDSEGTAREHAVTDVHSVWWSSEGSPRAQLTLEAKWMDSDRVFWGCQSTFVLEPSDVRWLECTTTIGADNTRELLLCEGPVVLAGEGSEHGAKKDFALFPGLDYIAADERSSATWHPRFSERDMRIAPDPIKITIPFMAVEHGRCVVGLMWNALDLWDGVHNKVSARFACPDFEQLYDHNHLSLFVPTVPEWVPENGTEASTLYSLRPDQPLRFEYQIVARPDASVLDVQRDWIERHGLFELPERPQPYAEFAAQAIDAENEHRFEKDRLTWLHVNRMPPGTGQFNPQLCTVMWLDSILTQDQDRRRTLRELVLRASRQHHRYMELILPFHVGLLDQAVDGATAVMRRTMTEQLPDGGWGLKKRTGLPEYIGKDGTVTSGTCASRAKSLMRYALVTGDTDAYDAARRGLDAIERDPIPRGGQTWEVPVQVADIIVAGYTAAAYLDAYRITGAEHDLKRAVRWAKTGVHFIYFWKDPEQAVMPGCSIPVYGNNWFGRPVQWCGRDLIEALLDLGDLGEDSLPWRHIAESIAIALMQQTLRPNLRMYPDTSSTPQDELYWPYPDPDWKMFRSSVMMFVDNFWLTSPRRFPCWFHMISLSRVAPYRMGMLESVYRLMGHNPRPETVVLRTPQGNVHITAAGRVQDAQAQTEGGAQFAVRYFAGETPRALVAGLAEPSAVLCDGQSLPAVDDLDAAETGWKRHRDMLLLKLPVPSDQPVQVVIRTARRN